MRYVIYGAGAVGGVVGARLAQAGHEVALIARGAHLAKIQSTGLRLITPAEDVTLQIAAAEDPSQLGVGRDGDVVLLAVKSQDTIGALESLRAAGADAVPVVCLQNGVENERVALRRFPEVYGAVVIAPTNHLEPGIVEASGAGLSGFIDIGRYPSGVDARARQVAADLTGSRIGSEAVSDVMRLKYAKLLMNLGNVVGALFAESTDRDELRRRARAEGETALAAAGIAHEDPGGERRREELAVAPIAGRRRGGSSSWQSLARGTGAIETDYLNGEISLLGRGHGVSTPLNDRLCVLAGAHARRGGGPGELDAGDVLSAVPGAAP